MRVLAIETSGRLGSIALLEVEAGRVLDVLERRTPEGERTARSLVPTMHGLLGEKGWRPAELDLVGVATGPGSFTGLRIGVVAAKTLAYATGAQLVGVPTLAAIAAGIEESPTKLWTVLDAQRQELFVASFRGVRPLIDEISPVTEILSVPQWVERLAPGDVVAGPPLAKLRGQLPAGVTIVDEALWEPKAAAVGRLGVQLLARGEHIDPLSLVPNYYRKSAAEEKAKN